MTTPPKGRRSAGRPAAPTITDPTILLLRCLARGATMPEMQDALGLSVRVIMRRISALEEQGLDIERPLAGGRREPGQYKLKDPGQVMGGIKP